VAGLVFVAAYAPEAGEALGATKARYLDVALAATLRTFRAPRLAPAVPIASDDGPPEPAGARRRGLLVLAPVPFCPAGEVPGGPGDDGRLDGLAGDTTSAHGAGFLFCDGVVVPVSTGL
jgi:hypothetical protein